MIRLNSKDVAEFMGKRHDNLMRTIRTDIKNLESPDNYYKEGSYTDGKGKVRACYEISIQGCERLSKKLSEEDKESFLNKCMDNAKESSDEAFRASESHFEKEYTVKEAAEKLGISERTIFRRIKAGELKSEKREFKQVIVSERTVITESSLEEYMRKQEERDV